MLRGLYAPFTRWCNESAAIYFAIVFFPIMIAVGAAIDYSRAIDYKVAMQAALDAAVLSGGRDGSASWTQIALNAFNGKLSAKFGPLPKPTFMVDPSTGNYTGTVTGSQPTSVLGVINIGSISVTARAAAVAADDDNSFVLALDHGQSKLHVWRVSKSSGDVALTTPAGEQTALAEGAILNPGNNIRTGQNGRVLLMRGEETILIAANSVIGIPPDLTEGLSTTIHQSAGSILFAVKKRNYKHFEVITPYLSAVVRGTQFRVTVNRNDARVDVLRGQVEVEDFKSGQYAVVLPGQEAKIFAPGPAGLYLSGSGTLSPIQQGTPRKSSENPIALSNEGLLAPVGTPNGRQVRVAPSRVETEWRPPSSEVVSSNESSWGSRINVLGRFFSNADGQRTQNDDFANSIVFACGVGLIVAFIIAVRRRWRSKE